jgi:D-citramalate synthase
MNHLTHQLKTPEQHFTEIAQTIALASANNIANVYLEDWSNGMRNSQTTYFNS